MNYNGSATVTIGAHCYVKKT